MGRDKDRMDELLNEALKSYSVVEPRRGLETRVLARLQAEEAKSPNRNWWCFVAAATAAVATLGIAGFLMVRPARTPVVSTPAEAMKHSSATKSTKPEESHETQKMKPATVSRPNADGSSRHRKVEETHEAEQQEATLPKLDQFPSPRPLSAEELRLAAYIAEHRDHALLVARAQTALSKLELQREQLLKPDGPAGWSSEESNP
jgi:hypothetical protein